MKIGIVTTFSDHGYEQYGKNFIQSCKKFLDKDITLYLYIDNAKLYTDDTKFKKLSNSKKYY